MPADDGASSERAPADSLSGTAAVVAGGSRGIGAACTEALVARGASVVVIGRRQAALNRVRASYPQAQVVAVEGSVLDPGIPERAVERAIREFGSCSILVNTVGASPGIRPLLDASPQDLEKTWNGNVWSALLMTRAAHRGWMGSHGGSVINVGSVAGLRPAPGVGAYAITKAALHHMTRQLAAELAPRVRVNAVAPATVRTPFSRVLWEGREQESAVAYPLGRLGEPSDVAELVVWLASPAADWVTGSIISVDGGLTGAVPAEQHRH